MNYCVQASEDVGVEIDPQGTAVLGDLRKLVATTGIDLVENPVKIQAHKATNIGVETRRIDEEWPSQGRIVSLHGIQGPVAIGGGS